VLNTKLRLSIHQFLVHSIKHKLKVMKRKQKHKT